MDYSFGSSPFLMAIQTIRQYGPETDDLWHISEAIRDILTKYKHSANKTLVSFTDLHWRCAYLFYYFSSHVHMVRECFRLVWVNDEFTGFDSYLQCISRRPGHTLDVCCVGGGPGTDLFGLHQFLKEFRSPCTIRGAILDKHIEWSTSFSILLRILNNRESRSPFGRDVFISDLSHYTAFDFTENLSDNSSVIDDLAKADLITMIKFVSAFDDENIERNLKKLFSLAKPGAMIIYVDNATRILSSIVKKSAEASGVLLLYTHDFFTYEVNSTEINFMYEYEPYFRIMPQQNGKVSVVLFRKPLKNLFNMQISCNGNDRNFKSIGNNNNFYSPPIMQKPLHFYYPNECSPINSPSYQNSNHYFYLNSPAYRRNYSLGSACDENSPPLSVSPYYSPNRLCLPSNDNSFYFPQNMRESSWNCSSDSPSSSSGSPYNSFRGCEQYTPYKYRDSSPYDYYEQSSPWNGDRRVLYNNHKPYTPYRIKPFHSENSYKIPPFKIQNQKKKNKVQNQMKKKFQKWKQKCQPKLEKIKESIKSSCFLRM